MNWETMYHCNLDVSLLQVLETTSGVNHEGGSSEKKKTTKKTVVLEEIIIS